jgi:Carboxypeptidase regulatory-like domain
MTSKGLMRLFATMLLGSIVLISAMNVSAQNATGKVIGTITDQQGAVIAGAKITVTNTATQVTRNALTNQDGYFEVLLLPIGNYRVTVEKDGFKKSRNCKLTNRYD